MTLAAPEPDKETTIGVAPVVTGSDRIAATSSNNASVDMPVDGGTAPTVFVPVPVRADEAGATIEVSAAASILSIPSLLASLDSVVPEVHVGAPMAPTSTAPVIPPPSVAAIPDVSTPVATPPPVLAPVVAPLSASVVAVPVMAAPFIAPPAAPPPMPPAPPAMALPPTPPPPPVRLVMPPPPPAPVFAAELGGRKPLIAQRETEQRHQPMPSEIQPNTQNRAKRRFRSRAARSSIVVVLDGLLSLAAIGAIILGVAAFAGRKEFELPGPLVASKVVIIAPKKSRDEIGDILEKAGVIADKSVFVYGSMLAQIPDLKAGEYEFKPGATMRDVAETMQQGKVVKHKITFPEGWTSEQIVQRLLDDPILAGKITAIPEEGSLLPDTYPFERGETRERILDLMRKSQDRRLTDIWAHRNAEALKMLKVPKDLVILASIVEKETAKPDERPRVAAVFVNRLNKGMRLETDPTILYGLYGGKAWQESRTITKADLVAPNPYNTYKINGLPPGPIGNPGRAAMEAVANPAQTSELFFVADGTGGHTFAETFEDHKKNVERWREIERQRRAADPNAAPVNGTGTGLQIPAVAPPTAVTIPNARQPVATPAVRKPPATVQQRPRTTTEQPPAVN